MNSTFTVRARQVAWTVPLLVVFFLPLLLTTGAGHEDDFLEELSLGTAIVAASALTVVIVLASRMRSLTAAFGIETVLRSHKMLAVATLVLVLAHLVLLVIDKPESLTLLLVWSAPPRARAATTATIALTLLCLLSIYRQRLGTRYEAWRWVHVVLGLTAVTGSALHVLWLDHLTRDALMLRWFVFSVVVLVLTFAYRWVVRPLLAVRHPFVIDNLRPESPSVSTLVLRPARGRDRGIHFDPGQFAWIRLDRPFGPTEEHPFTIASGSHRPRELEFTIRHTGDWTNTVAKLRPGRRVYVDGPYGSFTVDARRSAGLVLIAGGVGITPMMSMLRTLAHRRDSRRHLLIVAARSMDDLLFRDELDDLCRELTLTVVEVLSDPPPLWSGEKGRVDTDFLERVLPRRATSGLHDVYICGPSPMVAGVASALAELGVPAANVHTEQFDMV